MRRIAIAVLGVLFAGSIVGNAQQPTPPTFRAGTTLVNFTIVAVDARGNPITDLRKDAISIVEDEDWPEERWNDIAYRPLISAAVRLDARATFDASVLNVALQVASDDLHFQQAGARLVADVDIAVVEKTTEPTNVRVQPASIDVPSAAALPPTVSVASEFTLNPQTVAVRVIVRDKSTGRYGSVDLPPSQLAAP